MKILIIEDEIITATDLKMVLEKRGHQVLPICRNDQEAFLTLHESTPDLILADIRLKHSTMDGVDVVNKIQNHMSIPVIYLTSHTDPETFNRAKNTRPAAFLFKPFRKEEVVFQIELAFEHYKVNKLTNPEPETTENLFFPYSRGHKKIHKNSVLFIKAQGAYVDLYTADSRSPLVLSMNLGYVEQFFPAPNFYRLGRSYIINLDRIERFDSEYIYFEGSTEKVPIPLARKQEFLKMFTLAKKTS